MMRTLLCFVLVISGTVLAAGQERVIEKAAFDALVSEGSQQATRWKDQKYRMTVTTSSKADGRPQTDWSTKLVFEWAPGPAVRTISTSKFGDKTPTRMEAMRLGEWSYYRTGDGPWTRKEFVASAKKSEENKETSYEILATEVKYQHLGSGRLLNTPVEIYTKTERRTTTGKNNGETMESDLRVTYWIDSSGLILKSEYASDNRGATLVTHTRIVTEWELDPSISFAVPEIAPQ